MEQTPVKSFDLQTILTDDGADRREIDIDGTNLNETVGCRQLELSSPPTGSSGLF
jgi:hypothetical protein